MFWDCVFCFQVRTTALAFLKRMYEKDHLRDYIEKFALNYMQLLVHPNPPSLLFGADKDTGEGSANKIFYLKLKTQLTWY